MKKDLLEKMDGSLVGLLVSDRIIFMENGLIQLQGTASEVFESGHERFDSFVGRLG